MVGNILDDFCGTIAVEFRLPYAINRRHLYPFQYFEIDDTTDISHVKWVSGRYAIEANKRSYSGEYQKCHRKYEKIEKVDNLLSKTYTSRVLFKEFSFNLSNSNY